MQVVINSTKCKDINMIIQKD